MLFINSSHIEIFKTFSLFKIFYTLAIIKICLLYIFLQDFKLMRVFVINRGYVFATV